MSLRTEFAWGGFAGYKPERPQPNRSRVLLCAVCVCVYARVCSCVSARKHIPERSIGGWSRSRDFDQQTSFVSTSSPIETTFLVWNFHFSLIPPSFCFYFFSILALWSFFFLHWNASFFHFFRFFPFCTQTYPPLLSFPLFSFSCSFFCPLPSPLSASPEQLLDGTKQLSGPHRHTGTHQSLSSDGFNSKVFTLQHLILS